ncbi:MAG TPA: hypothetical protein VKY37_09735 [Brumimicrobium sp.]|nr:hypothetical protein [Brumimicrobium sp.]
MTSFDTLQSISSRLKELSHQLTTSKLSKEELEEFEMLSRKLYERAVILNYKAKEESVYGKSSQDHTGVENEEVLKDPVIEPVIEEPKKQEEKVEQPSSSGEIRFDFSSDSETFKSELTSKPTEVLTPKVEEVVELPMQENEPIEKSFEHVEEPIVPEVTINQSDEIGGDSNSFYERFSKAYRQAAGDKLGTSKINSLKGAVGLNDRLQFISELFGGDSDLYNSSIDVLDQFENSEAALRKLSEIAAKENWNKEESAVDDFAHLITRRYVD